MVGLSATLRDAGDFFATLTGTERSNVEVIAPAPDDLLPTSREYGIVLRGDPISGASFAVRNHPDRDAARTHLGHHAGHLGSVAFAFTDNLDVINRLYDNLRDAEGVLPTVDQAARSSPTCATPKRRRQQTDTSTVGRGICPRIWDAWTGRCASPERRPRRRH